MKKKHILLSAVLPAIILLASSCSNYLDELPDNRTDLNTEQAIAKLLVSAYPITSFAMIGEMTSDNTDNNGGTWTSYNLLQEQLATWKNATEIENDSPEALWEDCYLAVATCNQALKAIEKMGIQLVSIHKKEKRYYAGHTHILYWSMYSASTIAKQTVLRILESFMLPNRKRLFYPVMNV